MVKDEMEKAYELIRNGWTYQDSWMNEATESFCETLLEDKYFITVRREE